jgi:hypothetical protein
MSNDNNHYFITGADFSAKKFIKYIENFIPDSMSRKRKWDNLDLSSNISLPQIRNRGLYDINENDFVVVGITFHNRIDVPFGDKLVTPYIDEEFLKINSIWSEDEIQTLLNFQYFFTYNKLYKFRNLKRFNFIEKLLKDKKIKTYFWHVTEIVSKTEFQKICTDTNYETSDAHFSFNGHKDFANMLHKKIVNPTLI